MEEANRFGIMNTEDGDKIYEFEEKPESPKSNLASMGIYIFTWDRLRDALIEDNSIHPARPCPLCARQIIQAGIRNVYLRKGEGPDQYEVIPARNLQWYLPGDELES